jgi:phosphatidylinositol alpha-1,6-mannosyltransferase
VLSYQDARLGEAPIGSWGRVAACGGSKLKAALTCARWGRRFDEIHVLHLRLRPLLSLVAGKRARVFQWLMGIEAWRPARLDRSARTVYLPISNHTWDRFVASNAAARALPHEVVHPGLGDAVQDPPPAYEPNLVVMCGRMAGKERQKGFDETIAAWPAVVASVPGARLAIVGDGPDQPRLERLARARGVEDSVRFLGGLPEAEKQAWLARCQVFALPSRLEGFGLVYVEAMRFGRPCLIGHGDAAREVARPGLESVAVDAACPGQVGEGLIRLLTDEALYARLAANAWRRARDYLTEARFAARLTEVRNRHLVASGRSTAS